MEIYDVMGVKKDWNWLADKYKCQLLTAPAGAAFRLVRIDETIGPAAFIIDARNINGTPQINQPCAFSWVGLEDGIDLRGTGVKSVYLERAIVQNTEANGVTGFGFGGGSVIHETGPHTLWVLSPSLPSDGLAGAGWLGGTDHSCPGRLTFQIIETPVTPESENSDARWLVERLLTDGGSLSMTWFTPEAIVARAIAISNELEKQWAIRE